MIQLIRLLILLLLFSAAKKAAAQEPAVIGYLRDSITLFPISGGTITNWNTKKKVHTDGNGFFRIEAKANDLLYAQADKYYYDTLRVSALFTDTIPLYLSPSGEILPTVTITAGYTKYQMDSIGRIRTFLETRGHPLNSVSRSNSMGFGVGLNLDRLFKNKYKNQKKQEELFERTERFLYIEYRFSAQLVAYYTGLKGEALREFIYQYTPGYEWLRQHPTNEEVMWYINDKLKEYRKKKQDEAKQHPARITTLFSFLA